MKMKRNCNKTGRLVTRQSPPSVGWSSIGLRWWKGGPLRAMKLIRSRTFGLSLTRPEDKKFRTEKGMKKAICHLWDELDSEDQGKLDQSNKVSACAEVLF